jgi:hypothetical protein
MAFLFPKLFPNCIQEGGFNVSLSLENAMAMFWKPITFQISASCYDPFVEESFSCNTTMTTTATLDEIMCGSSFGFNAPFGGDNASLSFSGSAFKKGELYIPSLFFLIGLGSTLQGGGRYGVTATSSEPKSSGSISFNGQSFGMYFFNDDYPDEGFSGSGLLSIISERPFA